MAKDLPYFKFFVSEWNDGDITLEDFEAQGLFINICSYYWSKECDVKFNRLYKRFRGCESIIQTLLDSEIIKEIDGVLVISFLNEQQEERDVTSSRNSRAGKASAEKRRLAKLQQESNTNPTPVEITFNEKSTNKRREEKKREEKIIIPEISVFMVYIKDYLKDDKTRYDKIRTRMIDTYNAWKLNDWKDGNDKKIKNWKTKALMQLRYIK